jgi:large subunit ribosomal protein L25
MEQIELSAQVRGTTGKQVSHVRTSGYVPGIIYGSHYQATPIQMESKALHKALAQAGGNTLIRLQIGDLEPVAVLAREIQRDTLRHQVIHVDFQHVVMTEKITAEVPVRLVGESPAVKDLGGILVHGIDRLGVHCLPGDMPPAIEVNLGVLNKVHDTITVADLRLPASVTILAEPKTMIAYVEPPRIVEAEAEAEVAEAAAPTMAEPEIVGRRERAEPTEKEEKEK